MIAAPDGQTLDQGAEPMGHPPVVMVNNDDRAEGVRYEVLARRTEKKPSVDGPRWSWPWSTYLRARESGTRGYMAQRKSLCC